MLFRSSVPAIVEAAQKDYEPEVRVAALRTLGRFQERRQKEYDALAIRLRRQYEIAVARARAQQSER